MESQHRNGNHTSDSSLRDYANVADKDMQGTTSKKDPKFPERLQYVLSEMEKDGLQHIASWQPHGRCFIVHDQKLFTEKILPK
jgi:hypothetical protein